MRTFCKESSFHPREAVEEEEEDMGTEKEKKAQRTSAVCHIVTIVMDGLVYEYNSSRFMTVEN